MGILDRAVQNQASNESPLSQIVSRRESEDARARGQRMDDLNALQRQGQVEQQTLQNAASQKDAQGRENLSPLYSKWRNSAPEARRGVENQMLSADPDRAQKFLREENVRARQEQKLRLADQSAQAQEQDRAQKQALGRAKLQEVRTRVEKNIADMSHTKRDRQSKAAAKRAVRMQEVYPHGSEAWNAAGFKTNTGKHIPYEKAQASLLAAGMELKLYDRFETSDKEGRTALDKDVTTIAEILGVDKKAALEYKRNMTGKRESQTRAQMITKLVDQGYEGHELSQKLEALMALVKGDAVPEHTKGGGGSQDDSNPMGL